MTQLCLCSGKLGSGKIIFKAKPVSQSLSYEAVIYCTILLSSSLEQELEPSNYGPPAKNGFYIFEWLKKIKTVFCGM